MSNVVNLFEKRKKKIEDSDKKTGDNYFEEAIKANKEKEKRLKEERKKANKKVTKDYRLK